ncbi:MAG: fibronectin type III domain-containing protein [Chloroflexi bacterium]|nr:fibronectin type III domain-containing protein [Chloroflexota bacterium]
MSELTISTKTLWLIATLTVACSLIVSGISSSASGAGEGVVGGVDRGSITPAGSPQAADFQPILIPPQPQSSSQPVLTQNTIAERIPGAPAITGMTRQGDDLTVSWQAPTSGGMADYYKVQWRIRNSDASYSASGRFGQDIRTATLTGLNLNEAYQIRVLAGNDYGSRVSEVAEALTTGIHQPGLSRPSNVHVSIISGTDGQKLSVYWEEPASNDANPPTQYLIQWRKSYEVFDDSQQQAFDSEDLTDISGESSAARAFSATVDSLDTYKMRVVAVRGSVSVASAEALVKTPSNEIRYAIEELLVKDRGDEHPWLIETWNYINRPNFSIVTSATAEHASVQLTWFNSIPLNYTGASNMKYNSGWAGDESYLGLYTHELAHVYTLSNNLATEPGPIAVAFLYFSELANGASSDDCKASELYADAAKFAVFPEDYSNYWAAGCPYSDSRQPSQAAIELVRQAFRGEMPDWLYDTYENDDGSLDLAGIWSAVKAIEGNWYKTTVIYQLRNEFGGYCDAAAARESALGSSNLAQPWRDGGCGDD